MSGKRLFLSAKRSGKVRARLQLLSKDAAITLGLGNGSQDDPLLHGGGLRIFSPSGGFDLTGELPQQGWRYVKRPGRGAGYAFRGAGAVKSVLLKPGKGLKINARGTDLELLLATDPDPVYVVLTLGERRYCMTYGGETQFKRDRKYRAKRAPRPSDCGPDVASIVATGS